jgi:hypothetical protein
MSVQAILHAPKYEYGSIRSATSQTPIVGEVLRLLVLLSIGLTSARAQDPPPTPPPGQIVTPAEPQSAIPPDVRPAIPIADTERSAIELTALALDLHLIPAAAREEVRATLTLRNRSAAPLARIPLQLSSTLHWLTASAATPAGVQPIPFTQSPIATDADHTGYAREAIFTPAQPLASGATLTLSVFYAGDIPQNSDRLELIGAPHDKAIATDWDAIAPTSDTASTALRGFGNVLWYPVAAPIALFGRGDELFDLIAKERLQDVAVSIRLRLTVDYTGDPPDSAIFNGRIQPLLRAPDTDNQLIDATQGIATADFAPSPVGFRTPSLFLTAQHAVTTPDQLLTLVSPQPDVLAPYAAAATSLQALLSGFLGPTPLAPLLLLDHPGEPFEDAALIVAQLSPTAEPAAIAPHLIRGLTHAWLTPPARAVPASSLWIDDGLPEFMSLAWTERTQGREAAIGELRHAAVLIALAEPPPVDMGNIAPDSYVRLPGQPLTQAHADVFVRLKSAFVFWQLRELLGDALFSQSLTAWRHSIAVNPAADRDPTAFQKSIEKTSNRDLAWFFNDWVYADKGLPDLTIVQANPRAIAGRGGKSGGSIVAVEVRNDGDAIADVPVTVRAGTVSASERLRIPAHASASTRVVFEGKPESVEVNDGSVPEQRTTTHTLTLTAPAP